MPPAVLTTLPGYVNYSTSSVWPAADLTLRVLFVFNFISFVLSSLILCPTDAAAASKSETAMPGHQHIPGVPDFSLKSNEYKSLNIHTLP